MTESLAKRCPCCRRFCNDNDHIVKKDQNSNQQNSQIIKLQHVMKGLMKSRPPAFERAKHIGNTKNFAHHAKRYVCIRILRFKNTAKRISILSKSFTAHNQ